MRARPLSLLAVFAVAVTVAGCSEVMAPGATLRASRAVEPKVCADPADPVCSVFTSTRYAYDLSLGALPPGISDWALVITQFGGQLDFLGSVEHGGAPIVDVTQMYVRFFIDNGDSTLGPGDLQVVIVNSPTGATMHCGLIAGYPVGSALPTSSPEICVGGGTTENVPGSFRYDGFRTADLSAPLWESQGFARLRADERRALFLVEVGNVNVSSGPGEEPTLDPPTAPPTRVDTLSIVPPPPPPPPPPGGDTVAPTIVFSGNAGSYGLLENIAIGCTATDASSGIATSICPTVNAPAYSLPLGVTTLTATATDNAGNSATATTSFTVTVSATDLCALVQQQAPREANSLCAMLRRDTRAFGNHVRAQRGKKLSTEFADLLLRLAAGL